MSAIQVRPYDFEVAGAKLVQFSDDGGKWFFQLSMDSLYWLLDRVEVDYRDGAEIVKPLQGHVRSYIRLGVGVQIAGFARASDLMARVLDG